MSGVNSNMPKASPQSRKFLNCCQIGLGGHSQGKDTSMQLVVSPKEKSSQGRQHPSREAPCPPSHGNPGLYVGQIL